MELLTLYQQALKNSERKTDQARRLNFNSSKDFLTDAELIQMATNVVNGANFSLLLNGQTEVYNGDESRADAAFVSILCFYTQDDTQVERIWLQSKLYRNKLERLDYRRRTIASARALQTEQYSPGNSRSRMAIRQEEESGLGYVNLSEIYQIESRMLTEWGLTDEEKVTHFALAGLMNGRRQLRVGNRILAWHICKKEDRPVTESNEKSGSRRAAALLERFKGISYPVWSITDKGGTWHTTKGGTKNRLSKQYRLERKPFEEGLASSHSDPKYRTMPRQACEEAAARIARKYKLVLEAPMIDKPPKPDTTSIWLKAEKRFRRSIEKTAETFDDLEKPLSERQIWADRYKAYLDQRLIIKFQGKHSRKWNRNKSFRITNEENGGT